MTQADHDRALVGQTIVLVGGSGFVGRHVAQAVLRAGARVRIAARHLEKAWAMKTLGDLGCVEFARVDVTQPETVARALNGADAVVNLVGAFTGNLDAVQGAGVGALATAARGAGARAFVHLSAIGADAASRVPYARTKAEGEAAVLAAFPTASVLRPSVIFGPDDNFINMFGQMMVNLPFLPVFVPTGRLQPVFVDDVAAAVVAALVDPRGAGGRTFELGGPEVLTMLDLNQRIATAIGRGTRLIPMADGIAALFAALPGTPISMDQIRLLQAGNVANAALPGLADLGVAARPLGLFLDRWMARYRKHGRFGARR